MFLSNCNKNKILFRFLSEAKYFSIFCHKTSSILNGDGYKHQNKNSLLCRQVLLPKIIVVLNILWKKENLCRFLGSESHIVKFMNVYIWLEWQLLYFFLNYVRCLKTKCSLWRRLPVYQFIVKQKYSLSLSLSLCM